MGEDTGELNLQNESVNTDPLLGDVQSDYVASSEKRKFNGSGQTIEQDILIYIAGRESSVSAMIM